jgi:predicted nuclease with TOPRIM domain
MTTKEAVKLSPTVTEALAERGVVVDHNNSLPKGQWTNKDLFARVISALREAESQSNREVRRLEAENRALRDLMDELRDRMSTMEAAVRAMRVRETLDGMPELTAETKTKLLAIA